MEMFSVELVGIESWHLCRMIKRHFLSCREKAVQAGRSEGNGGYLIRNEQLHNAAVPKTGFGGIFSQSIQRTALCSERHSSHTQPGSHPSCTGTLTSSK